MKKNDKKQVIVFGTSGHAKVCIDILELQGYRILGLISEKLEDVGHKIAGVLVLGQDTDPKIVGLLDSRHVNYFVAIGDNEIRKRVVGDVIKKFRKKPINAIHPDSVISRHAKLGYGNFINCGVKINAGVRIGNGVLLNTSATIDHDVILKDYSQISPGVNLAGWAVVGPVSFIGTGAIVIPKVIINSGAIIGAGAVVIKDIPDRVVAVGCPAKVIKKI